MPGIAICAILAAWLAPPAMSAGSAIGHGADGEPGPDTGTAAAATSPNRFWKPFRARYSVYRNGKLTGKSDVTMTFDGDRWRVESETSGTHGLAKLLKVHDNGYVSGHLNKGRFRPDQYEQHTRVIGVDKQWSARFDWDAKRVHVLVDDKPHTLDMGGGALDSLTITLEIRRRLRISNHKLRFRRVDEDRIKDQAFRVLDPQVLETSLGCIETTPVERIHSKGTRFTRAWHAPALQFLTVRMEHGKVGGEHIEMRIAELELDGQVVEPGEGCGSRQVDTAGR